MTKKELWEAMAVTTEWQEAFKCYNAWQQALNLANEYEAVYNQAADTRDETPEYKAWIKAKPVQDV